MAKNMLRDRISFPENVAGLSADFRHFWDNLDIVATSQSTVVPELPSWNGDFAIDDALLGLAFDDNVPWDEEGTDASEPPPEPLAITRPVIAATSTPTLRVTYVLSAPPQPPTKVTDYFELGLRSHELTAKVDISYGKISLSIAGEFEFSFSRTLLTPVAFRAGSYQTDERRDKVVLVTTIDSYIFDSATGIRGTCSGSLDGPFRIAGTDIIIDNATAHVDLSGDQKCLAFSWEQDNLAQWLSRISHALGPADQPATGGAQKATITARVLFNESDITPSEIRIDIHTKNTELAFSLPGVRLSLPSLPDATLLLGGEGRSLNQLALIATAKPDSKRTLVKAETTFAWDRDDDRELQANADQKPDPLLSLEINSTDAQAADSVSVMLMDLDLSAGRLPTFMRQLATPLSEMSFDMPETLCNPTSVSTTRLNAAHWEVKPTVSNDFKLPFLEQKDGEGVFGQFLQLKRSDKDFLAVDFFAATIALKFEISLNFGRKEGNGGIVVDGPIAIGFNWERMSLTVKHDEGVRLLSRDSQVTGKLFDLAWTLRGAEVTVDDKKCYHLFTLVTKNYNYAVQMAPGAAFELEFDKISDEPIVFRVSDFQLSSNGVSLTAEVADNPVRLNGIDTRFKFSGSRLEIKDNKITDFTLAGSGPLPPDLVGEAMVDIGLQFKQIDGNFTLVEGHANLKSNKLLHCKGTRFEFSIDAIGLKYVNDGKTHLYFTLSGMAQYALASGDDKDGPLALLPKVKIQMVECPLCGDVSVLARHIKFLVDLPKPVSFNFLGCFEFELRGIGFVPQAKEFGGDGAMSLTGQVMFAQGAGDIIDARIDFHNLLIGLPARGSIFPRLHFEQIEINLKVGEAFKVHGLVKFYDEANQVGFAGEGMMEMAGMPSLAASFAFMRVRRDENSAWLRAWFIYLEIRRISIMIPVIQIYIREIGLGFGYRYTIASIKAADQENDVKKLVKQLKALSRTQGDLAKIDRWAIDLEDPGQDPRWTIVFRAMISQGSASPTMLQYNEPGEITVPSMFLIDAMIAFRSDLTFYMAARAWLNTNYQEFNTGGPKVRDNPLFSGFVLLSVRQKRFLAHMSSNPGAYIGDHPPLPDFVKAAIRGARFSSTLLIQPGLMQFDLGWPNAVGWDFTVGPFTVQCLGGFLFRISSDDFVIGTSFMARGRLEIKASLDLGLIGVWVEVLAEIGFGTRLIARLAWSGNKPGFLVYGAIGLELMIRIKFGVWIKIPLVFTSIKISFSFEFEIGFTAGIEVALGTGGVGARGSGTLFIGVMGHRFQVSAKFSVNEDAVVNALKIVDEILNMGLDASDAPNDLPGLSGDGTRALPAPAARKLRVASIKRLVARASADGEKFHMPGYTIYVNRNPDPKGWSIFAIMPRGEVTDKDGNVIGIEQGFLPPPPVPQSQNGKATSKSARSKAPRNRQDGLERVDFELSLPSADGTTLKHFDPITQSWVDCEGSLSWTAKWDAVLSRGAATDDGKSHDITLQHYLLNAFVWNPSTVDPKGRTEIDGIAISDPDVGMFKTLSQPEEDSRVHNPTDDAFESAVRGAVEQFAGSPFFKFDPDNAYDQVLKMAFDNKTTIYHPSGKLVFEDILDPAKRQKQEAEVQQDAAQNQRVLQTRGMIIHSIVQDVRNFASAARNAADLPQPDLKQSDSPADNAKLNLAFHMGLVFAFKGATPDWLDSVPDDDARKPRIKQRRTPIDTMPEPGAAAMAVETFNVSGTDFATNPPEFQRVKQYTDANTIAIAWDLAWTTWPGDKNSKTASRAEPEHHLAFYEVRRRSLDSREPEAQFKVKPAEVAHLEGTTADHKDGVLRRLKPRFNFVDNFNHETLEEQAQLPQDGRSYLYTITPVDIGERRGRPLTLVSTRYPNQPPAVPTDARLTVEYDVNDLPRPNSAASATTTEIVQPRNVTVNWTPPPAPENRPSIFAAQTHLLFRKHATLPIGSFGLDGVSQGVRVNARPASNARALPTDIRITLSDAMIAGSDPAALIRELRNKGVLPISGWQPESWHCFIQTQALNGVLSALAPVELHLRVVRRDTTTGFLSSEERQMPELEWLAKPGPRFFLPPEDQRAQTAAAHMPMPDPNDLLFRGSLTNIKHQPHPAGLRCIRFRWNQGPSEDPQYPLDLNAGYALYQLDADSATDTELDHIDTLRQALRRIQEVQMLPSDDLLLAPGDTLSTARWEAWYASDMLRQRSIAKRNEMRTESSNGPWYAWRDSVLEWPRCPTDQRRAPTADQTADKQDPLALVIVEDDGRFTRNARMHPVLQRIVDQLISGGKDKDDRVTPGVLVDKQLFPPDQPGELADLLRVTAPKTDPYGWGVLQRFGLSVAFTLRRKSDSALIAGQAALDLIKRAIERAAKARAVPPAKAEDETRAVELMAKLQNHLHVEVLFQPGKTIELQKTGADAAALLAITQLSLRPLVRQTHYYAAYTIEDQNHKLGDVVTIEFTLAQPASMIVDGAANTGAGQIEFVLPGTVRRAFKMPSNGNLVLLMRSTALPASVSVIVEEKPQLQVNQVPFDPRDERAARFSVSAAIISALAKAYAGAGTEELHWRNLRLYLESFSATEGPRIRVPTNEKDIEAWLPAYMEWSQRFFDHGGDVVIPNAKPSAEFAAWLATAYPRASTPAYASPDESGRLKYDHLIEDQWAHNFRHYIAPYSRYDLLWRSLWQSPALYPLPNTGAIAVEPEAGDRDLPSSYPNGTLKGGLDVVLDRTRKIDAPFILSSTRLDAPSLPGQPVAPGATWEVIIARHSEQILSERNQTVARRLAFRGVAFTLLRRFAYVKWINQLQEALPKLDNKPGYTIRTRAVQNELPALPGAYPSTPDHIEVTSAELTQRDALSVDLPLRLGAFQQGATVLQWDALPFYYQHRLLAIAQSSDTVSPINDVVQNDFEYRAPLPEARMAGDDVQEVTGIIVNIPLKRFWDSLPPDAQQRWLAEQPDALGADNDVRKYSALPDPEVVYQIVEVFSGNIEVQLELLFGKNESKNSFYIRQLGKNFLGKSLRLNPPAANQAPFILTLSMLSQLPGEATVVQDAIWQTPSKAPKIPNLTYPTAQHWRLVWNGEMSDAARQALAALPGERAFKDALARLAEQAAKPGRDPSADVMEIAPLPIEPARPELGARIKIGRDDAAGTYTKLRWVNDPMSDSDMAAFLPIARAWAVSPDVRLALDALLEQLDGQFYSENLPPARPIQADLPDALRQRLLIAPAALTWTSGAPTDAERVLVSQLLSQPAFSEPTFHKALMALLAKYDGDVVVPVPGADFRLDEKLPPELRAQLTLDPTNTLIWKGPSPTDVQRAALAQLLTTIELPGIVKNGLGRLQAEIDRQRAVDLPAEPPRPRQDNLPELLRAQLTVEATRLTWRGRLKDAAQLATLRELAGDPAFVTAMREIAAAIAAAVIETPMAIALRPTQPGLPETLRDQLLLGAQPVVALNLITATDAAALRATMPSAPERRAVERLYRAALSASLRGRRLEIRTRRGNATPSERVPISVDALSEAELLTGSRRPDRPPARRRKPTIKAKSATKTSSKQTRPAPKPARSSKTAKRVGKELPKKTQGRKTTRNVKRRKRSTR